MENGEFIAGFQRAGSINTQLNNLTWTFPHEIFAFGLDLNGAISSSTGTRFDGNFNGDQTERLMLSDYLEIPGTGFFGIIGASSFDQVILRRAGGGGNNFKIDNLSFASAVAVSAPASYSFFFALLGMFIFRKFGKGKEQRIHN